MTCKTCKHSQVVMPAGTRTEQRVCKFNPPTSQVLVFPKPNGQAQTTQVTFWPVVADNDGCAQEPPLVT